MIKEIMRDPIFLSMPSAEATIDDVEVGEDLLDTLMNHKNDCVGMAANMIGVRKNIIAIDNDGEYLVMYNPRIISKDSPYEAVEGCLSLAGEKKTKRYHKIKVEWQNELFQKRIKNFIGFTAQIIQHEIDHCNGILI